MSVGHGHDWMTGGYGRLGKLGKLGKLGVIGAEFPYKDAKSSQSCTCIRSGMLNHKWMP